MSVKIVMGPSCAGKSTFIKNTFPTSKVIDLWTYQEHINPSSVTSVMDSYIATRDALVDAIKDGYDVVLEHTLLKAKRRPMYIDAIKEATDEPIDIYVMIPDLEDYLEFCKARKMYPSEDRYKDMMDLMEVPTYEEGFAHIYIIKPKHKKESNS